MDGGRDHLGLGDAIRVLRLLPHCSHVESEEGVPHRAEVQEMSGYFVGEVLVLYLNPDIQRSNPYHMLFCAQLVV